MGLLFMHGLTTDPIKALCTGGKDGEEGSWERMVKLHYLINTKKLHKKKKPSTVSA